MNRILEAPGRIALVASHTWRETVRDRVFLVSIVFVVLMLGASLVVSPLAAGENDKLIQDLGLASISGIGLLLAIFVGASLVYREVEQKTIYTVLARPIHRAEYLAGKYVGMLLTILFNLAIMSALFLSLIHFHLGAFQVGLLAAITLIGAELAVISAFSLLFSVVASPFLSAFFTVMLFIAGHLSRDIFAFAELLPPGILQTTIRLVGSILPNLEYFNVKGMAVYGKPIPPEMVGAAILYGVLYVGATLLVAMVLFRRKDLR